MYTRLLDHLSVHNSLTSFHSTEDVLLRTVEDWRFDVDHEKAVAAVFIDLTNTFGSISHSLLLRKLYTIGVVDTALCWFQSSMATPLLGCMSNRVFPKVLYLACLSFQSIQMICL